MAKKKSPRSGKKQTPVKRETPPSRPPPKPRKEPPRVNWVDELLGHVPAKIIAMVLPVLLVLLVIVVLWRQGEQRHLHAGAKAVKTAKETREKKDWERGAKHYGALVEDEGDVLTMPPSTVQIRRRMIEVRVWVLELARCYLELEQADKAVKELDRLGRTYDRYAKKAANPRMVGRVSMYFALRGWCALQKKDLKQADAKLRSALVNQKDNPLANALLLRIALDAGRWAGADRYYDVIAKNPLFAKEVEDYLSRVEKTFLSIDEKELLDVPEIAPAKAPPPTKKASAPLPKVPTARPKIPVPTPKAPASAPKAPAPKGG